MIWNFFVDFKPVGISRKTFCMKIMIITMILSLAGVAGYSQQKDSMAKFVPPVIKEDRDTATVKFAPPIIKKTPVKKKKDKKVKFTPPVIKKDGEKG